MVHSRSLQSRILGGCPNHFFDFNSQFDHLDEEKTISCYLVMEREFNYLSNTFYRIKKYFIA